MALFTSQCQDVRRILSWKDVMSGASLPFAGVAAWRQAREGGACSQQGLA